MERLFAVIEDNKIVNIIVGVEDEVVAANPDKYVEYTNGFPHERFVNLDYNNFIQMPVSE